MALSALKIKTHHNHYISHFFKMHRRNNYHFHLNTT